jgi:hypothetical protein
MKRFMLLTLFIAIGCILAAGCVVAQPKKVPGNSTVTPTNTFTPLLPTTTVPDSNVTVPITQAPANNTSQLKGPVRVSIGRYSVDYPLPVLVDNETVGVVTAAAPLDLKVNVGNHSVAVCVGVICPKKYVNVIFAKNAFLDFEDLLKTNAEFSKPTIRIVKSFRTGNGVGVEVEFINPTQNDITMSAEIICGYSYIDGRTNIRMGDSVRTRTSEFVGAGQTFTRTVDLNFAYGNSYSYDEPRLGDVTYH